MDANDILRERGADALRAQFDRQAAGANNRPPLDKPSAGERPPLTWLRDIALERRSGYLVKGLIFAGDLSVWFGPSGSGKSFLLADIAAHIAAGKSWCGRAVCQCGVLIIALEGRRGMQNRLIALREKFGKDIPLALYDGELDLSAARNDIDLLIETMRRHLPERGLIIIDTFNRALGASSENDAKDMGRAFQALARLQHNTDAHVALVHHPGHADKDRPRGYSSIRPNVDTLVRIERAEGTKNSKIHVDKQKDGEDGYQLGAYTLEPVDIGKDEDGESITTCLVEYLNLDTPESKQRKEPGGQAGIALRALKLAVEDGAEEQPASDRIPRTKRVVRLPLWKRYCEQLNLTNPDSTADSFERAFRRTRQQLQQTGFIGVWGDYVWLEK